MGLLALTVVASIHIHSAVAWSRIPDDSDHHGRVYGMERSVHPVDSGPWLVQAWMWLDACETQHCTQCAPSVVGSIQQFTRRTLKGWAVHSTGCLVSLATGTSKGHCKAERAGTLPAATCSQGAR